MDLKLGDILEGIIVDFTYEGKGVVKIDKFIIFVLGGVIGDKVSFKITKIKKNFAEGEVLEIIEPSKDRAKNKLDLEEAVGVIPLVEYDYEKGLEWKREKVKKDLEKIAGLKNIEVKDTIGMDKPYRYRNNVQIAVGEKNKKIVIGFYELGTNDIVDMESSILISKKANEALKAIREWIDKYDIKPFNKKRNQGNIRHIGIRSNKEDKLMIILVTANKKIEHTEELVKSLKENNVISIYQNINNSKGSATFGKEYKLIYGHESLIETIGKYRFKVSPNSFLQVNTTQVEVLYDKAMEFLNPQKEDVVADIYSGIGTISLYIAKKAKKVIAIESVKKAVDDAKYNALLNDIQNVRFLKGKAELIFPKLVDEGLKINKLVLDPPRKGCEKEVLEAIIKVSPERIVYVSCNSSTLARDIKILVENGYKVVEVQPVDMFPHTVHVETVVLMSRVEK
ncbi:23S rRNA (uracil(1939)-C(5))-methyltransferase RlmD [Tissierella creatinophila]|uniref:23S rRNA (Uracil-C(5))-methyltransferase RlmCD n=1 Tax=Tissierella creatinophila DSM 6911 TaxID=1123403 RepID=A0A1U7M5Y1_TISCR|nr:23S rRNA (uracil(1939)-C(5))-methyltransferase RlmD [Tissierella creatinophila]OLS02734.1 23S rRNA (uracil-C(5))-methyltransferase RlmCD [Tissierella creatinophila DSM 6911]